MTSLLCLLKLFFALQKILMEHCISVPMLVGIFIHKKALRYDKYHQYYLNYFFKTRAKSRLISLREVSPNEQVATKKRYDCTAYF